MKYYLSKGETSIMQVSDNGGIVQPPKDAKELTVDEAVEAYARMGFRASLESDGTLSLTPLLDKFAIGE